MPAKSAAQLKKAYVEAKKGKAWAKEMVAHTPDDTKSRLMKGAHEERKRIEKRRK